MFKEFDGPHKSLGEGNPRSQIIIIIKARDGTYVVDPRHEKTIKTLILFKQKKGKRWHICSLVSFAHP